MIQGSDEKRVKWLKETAIYTATDKTVHIKTHHLILLKLTTVMKYMGGFCTRAACLYHQLQYAIKKENSLSLSLSASKNLKADWPKSVAFIHTHNRTVNVHMSGNSDVGKHVDQLIEYYNFS